MGDESAKFTSHGTNEELSLAVEEIRCVKEMSGYTEIRTRNGCGWPVKDTFLECIASIYAATHTEPLAKGTK